MKRACFRFVQQSVSSAFRGNPFRLIDRTWRVKGNNAVSNHSNSGLCLKISLQVFLSPLSPTPRPSPSFYTLSLLFFFFSLFLSSLSLTRGHTLQARSNYSEHRLHESYFGGRTTIRDTRVIVSRILQTEFLHR